ncbi:PREDICTED: archaemetzincin-1 [Bison bison bison]|uniref:Archaemetzincin-1 n=1 Tax=Bison bison bison TaxID=43346 RepID=A0A6P3IXS4_BISBB|nr:PREDICTED: archaemetzincin-1 [Bison bison bison]
MLQCRPAEEFSFGPRALKDALLSTDPALRQLYTAAFSPAERLFLAEAYNPQRTLFGTLLIRTAFDWLLSRPEAPEDFQTFHAALPPRKQSLTRKHIYLQPIGLSEGPAGSVLLDQLRSCTEAFFLGLQVRCLPSVAAASIHCSSRPGQDPDRLQLHTDGILSFLKSSKPGDALCVLGLTLSDLYPCEAWTFTFGTFLPGHGEPAPGAPASALWLGHRPGAPGNRLYAWTQAAAGTQPSPAAVGEPSVSEDTLPCSADSGLCCESDSEPGSSLSEPLSPDAWSQAFPAGLELDAEDGLGSLAAVEGPGEALAEHGRWLAACIQWGSRGAGAGLRPGGPQASLCTQTKARALPTAGGRDAAHQEKVVQGEF